MSPFMSLFPPSLSTSSLSFFNSLSPYFVFVYLSFSLSPLSPSLPLSLYLPSFLYFSLSVCLTANLQNNNSFLYFKIIHILNTILHACLFTDIIFIVAVVVLLAVGHAQGSMATSDAALLQAIINAG